MTTSEIQSYISAIEMNSSLNDEMNFETRVEAMEFLEFEIFSAIDELERRKGQTELTVLQYRANTAMARMEKVNLNLFEKLRAQIQAGRYRGKEFEDLINLYVGRRPEDSTSTGEPRYDNLDMFVDGVLGFHEIPQETKALETEMVYYQKTPARMVFDLVKKAHFKDDDVFYDLGSGLGQVSMLVNLQAGIRVKGVEFEPGFCDYARQRVTELNLRDVVFVNNDARKVNYADGTVFFMFTPFTGGILHSVLDLLKKEALKRTIRIVTLGPCTATIALQDWLEFAPQQHHSRYALGFFTSVS